MSIVAAGHDGNVTDGVDISRRGLVVKELSKSFGTVQALINVSLDVRPGEVLALVGENGAGKSTLLKILQGDLQADSGELRVDGQRVQLSSPVAARRLGVRVVHQEPEIVPGVSVAENLYLGELRHGPGRYVSRRSLLRRAQERLDVLGFGRDLSSATLGSDLSTAQRQLVEIARALKPGVQVLALDEPTSSLTEEEVDRLLTLIRRLRTEGVAVIYVSHRLREVLQLADRVAVLRDGALIDIRDADDVTEDDLVRMMVGRPLLSVFGNGESRPATGTVVLRAHQLTTGWLRGVDLDLHRCEVVGVAGLIGSGRSELAKALFGAVPLHAGHIEISGRKVRLSTPRQAIAAGIGFAPEDRKAEALLLDRSVKENVTVCVLRRLCTGRIVNRKAQRRVAQELVGSLRIKTPNVEQPVSALSGGNQQKVVLARWLAVTPKVLILDEPTRGIDVGAKAEIYRLIRELAADGLAVLFISSELPEVIGVSDRVLVMREGRLTGDLPRQEATEERILSLAMLDQLSSSEVLDNDGATPYDRSPKDCFGLQETS